VEAYGHVAIVPLVRAGLYVAEDVSTAPGLPAREITSGGLHIKLIPPLFSGRWRAWLAAGFGYAVVHAPAGGGYFEVPVGLGVGFRVRRRVELTGELGARFGFGSTGGAYGAGTPGDDTYAGTLSIGVSFEL
jgi:hypothetical protein